VFNQATIQSVQLADRVTPLSPPWIFDNQEPSSTTAMILSETMELAGYRQAPRCSPKSHSESCYKAEEWCKSDRSWKLHMSVNLERPILHCTWRVATCTHMARWADEDRLVGKRSYRVPGYGGAFATPSATIMSCNWPCSQQMRMLPSPVYSFTAWATPALSSRSMWESIFSPRAFASGSTVLRGLARDPSLCKLNCQ